MCDTLGVQLDDPTTKKLVDRIFWGRFSGQVRAAGLDPDDVVAQVYLGIVARNAGRRPYDPRVSSLSNYVYIVTQSVVRNAVESNGRAVRRGWVTGAEEDAAGWDLASYTDAPMEDLLDEEPDEDMASCGVGTVQRLAAGPWATRPAPSRSRPPGATPKRKERRPRPTAHTAMGEADITRLQGMGLARPLLARIASGVDAFQAALDSGMDFLAAADLAQEIRAA